MVRFFIERPIAISMVLIATLAIGIVSFMRLPISLMPDIDVPVITVRISIQNASAREIENKVINFLRKELVQIRHFQDFKSETRDENSTIKLHFEHGTNIDLAFIEVNEKIDRAMAFMPRNVSRPRVIKASISDIPVFYLDLTLSEQSRSNESDDNFVSENFLQLSEFASQVIKRRLEQLPEIAMVDMSGMVYPELLIVPDKNKLSSLKLSYEQLEEIIRKSNINLGSLTINDGQYQYSLKLESSLNSKKDIEELFLRIGDRMVQIKNLASIIEKPQTQRGLILDNEENALTLAIIKQNDAKMNELKEKLNNLIIKFQKDYPNIKFRISRDQTSLLDYSISNLKQDLLWGAVLALLIMSLFLRDYKSALLVGLTMPFSLIISLLFFYIFKISINIISLSGLVLGIGMMIDNSVIVIDNINQYLNRGFLLTEACVLGTQELIIPMLSSVLTTCAVFIPLIFLSGISGALFYDQAIAVTIGAFVSLLLSISIVPVYFNLIYNYNIGWSFNYFRIKNKMSFISLYEKSFKYLIRHQLLIFLLVALILFFGFLSFKSLSIDRLPALTKDEIIIKIDWNEKINIQESRKRTVKLMHPLMPKINTYTSFIGVQDFVLDKQTALPSEVKIYCKAISNNELRNIQDYIRTTFQKEYPHALFSFNDSENVFNLIFDDDEPNLSIRLHGVKLNGKKGNNILRSALIKLKDSLPKLNLQTLPIQENLVLKIDQAKLLHYNISADQLYTKLKFLFSEHHIFSIGNNQNVIPVLLGNSSNDIFSILNNSEVANSDGIHYPLIKFVTIDFDEDIRTITSGKNGEYYPINFDVSTEEANLLIPKITSLFKNNGAFEFNYVGRLFSSEELIKQLSIILIISLALLYFILAAQFESLKLPFIVLLEIPIDIAGALIFLKIFGSGINLMSMIGMIVMGGIIINDSILKIDTIINLRKQGFGLMRAVIVGGQRRIQSIIMTSLITMLAMIPILITPGLGSELQKPLALSLIGGMLIGTLVSIYVIPVCYYYMERSNSNE